MDRQEALVERDVETAASEVGRGQHLVGLEERVGDGLVGDDVLARREGLDDRGVVQVVGQAHVDDVDGRVVEQSPVVSLGTLRGVVARDQLELCRIAVGDGHPIDIGMAQHRFDVDASNEPAPDDPDVQPHLKPSPARTRGWTKRTAGRTAAPDRSAARMCREADIAQW